MPRSEGVASPVKGLNLSKGLCWVKKVGTFIIGGVQDFIDRFRCFIVSNLTYETSPNFEAKSIAAIRGKHKVP